ncbi:Uncharacterised protein [uncultured archaeon]|nr:Uncharacterised protein [uncultured archaeon]
MAEPIAKAKHAPDFICIEIRPVDHIFPLQYFSLFLTKKSLAKNRELLVTSPEFREFLHANERGIKAREFLESKKAKEIFIGELHYIVSPRKILCAHFYPFLGNHGVKLLDGLYLGNLNILMGKGIGGIIDAQVFKYFRKRFPGRIIVHSNLVLEPRRRQLERRSGKKIEKLGAIEEEYRVLKNYLKGKRAEKNYLSRFHKRAQTNKQNRLAKPGLH